MFINESQDKVYQPGQFLLGWSPRLRSRGGPVARDHLHLHSPHHPGSSVSSPELLARSRQTLHWVRTVVASSRPNPALR